MRNALLLLAAALIQLPAGVHAQQEESYDYWSSNRQMVRRGQEAVMTCNGLFASNRTYDQVKAQELAFIPEPVYRSSPGDVVIDRERRAVAIGSDHGVPTIRAAFREGLGCVVLPPDQTFDDIDALPSLDLPAVAGDPATIPWPDGDRVEGGDLPPNVDGEALAAASDWAFERESPEQVTIGLVVVHKGEIIHERYTPGVNATTKTRTWSVAKSIASTLIGMNVDAGRMALDDPLPFDWLPEARVPEKDPRSAITLRHALNMSSGLYPIDNGGAGVRHRVRPLVLGGLKLGDRSAEQGPHPRARNPLRLRELRHAARDLRDEARARGRRRPTSSSRERRSSTASGCEARFSASTGSATTS